ncbi:MAG: hypothetical protein ABGY08_03845 [Gammaproteobacteria bacterium]
MIKIYFGFDVRIVPGCLCQKDDWFTGLSAKFNAIPVDCNEIAMQ